MDIRYCGERTEKHGAQAWIEHDGRRLTLNPRYDLANHSPDGFEWGYSGSGPAQLALAILAHHCRNEIETDATVGALARTLDPLEAKDPAGTADQVAIRLYQHFKARYVAGIDSGRWVIEAATVRGFLTETLARKGRP